MKKQRHIFWIGALLLVLFIAASIWIFYQSNLQLRQGYLASEGNAAENFAVLAAENIHLTDQQVAKLKEYTYAELLASEENKALAAMMSNPNFTQKVDYAYLMMHLKEEEVRYTVTAENQDQYDAPIGTKLDIMWLLDVNVSEAATQLKRYEETAELNRYSYYIEDDALIFGEAPTYLYNSSEWGDHICGYAPIYTKEGTYIGVIGVELQTGDFDSYSGQAVWVLGTLMCVTLLMLTLVFLFVYRQYRNIQHDKIYTDALTQLGNRSFYNDQFLKYMNAHRKGGPFFALMMADIDYFKTFNDTFGHEVGDAVLIELGELLLETFGKHQTVRFGGEEFVVGLWVKDEIELKQKIDGLFAQVAAHKFSNFEVTITLSLGCSYDHTDALNGWLLAGMLRAADGKLYECKEHGRNQYRMERFDPAKDHQKVP